MKWDVIPESLTLEIKGDRPVKRLVRVMRLDKGWYMWVRGEGVGVSDISEWKLTGSADSQKRVVVEG